MVDAQTLQTISIGIASAGILVAAIYYILQLRHQKIVRQTDLVIRLASDFKSKEFLEAEVDVLNVDFEDYNDFAKRYGKLFSRNQIPMSITIVGNFFEQLGVLYKNGLLSYSLIIQLFPTTIIWEKMRPLIEGVRKESHNPLYYENFEYLYNEVKKREQRGASHG